MFAKISMLLAATAGLSVSAFPTNVSYTHSTTHVTARHAQDACGKLSQLYREAVQINVTSPVFPGQLAFDCLHALPFDQDKASHRLEGLNKYLEFHSTTETLKYSPSDYFSPPTDIWGGMENIYHEAITGGSRLWKSAYDGHLSVSLCSQSIFWFKSALQLVSISTDGLRLPQVYAYEDAKLLAEMPKQVSPIVSINNRSVSEYIEQLFMTQLFQDPDARYNRMFTQCARSLTTAPNEVYDYYTVSDWWPYRVAHHSYRFQNRTELIVPITATYNGGGEFHFENGNALWTTLCLPQVQPPGLSNATLESSLEKSIAAGKERLIIDLSENDGGHTNHGYDTFQALFPGEFMYTAARYRDHEALRLMLKAFRNVTVDSPLYQDVSYFFSPPSYLKPDQKTHFSSWEELYGPHQLLGMNQTSELAIFDFNLASTFDSPIRVFGPVRNN
ncbi:hypothetical protein BJY01DRAFT_249055 [Aspergillus pseudoustus]|uniref:CPAF-like PDZ domain-containing protein n=1 Tax=Aspergillus pseudoustus TaxID=1810923 RepID=A0ABR4JRA3_9EURO